MSELNPCPNCGGKPKLHRTARKKVYYQCNGDCWLKTRAYWSEQEAAKAWNAFRSDKEMDVEEAIEVLENGEWWNYLDQLSCDSEKSRLLHKALDLAIEALRKEME